ncbi:hypothetical protein [Tritonibacter mobilis]|uniref:hypothetical protein n=1 Tax=Alphaproteobacteria TaxID=28211 RepID=UPI001C93AAC3|nr:hypothetical protein [Tritonibacter mobilis]MBY6000782.1 hypothetical protein [Tritonibacter mobilis]
MSEEKPMHRPKFRWEWNINTIAVLIGFASGLVAWGWTLKELQSGRQVNSLNIERLDRRLTKLEADARRLDNHELRLGNVEKQASDAAAAMRAVEGTLNGLAADMRVTREILQRLEAAQRGREPQ